MIFELSKWEGMSAVMAMKTWVEALKSSFENVKKSGKEERERSMGEGIVYGVNHLTDPTLITKEFAPRVQIFSSLKHGQSFFLFVFHEADIFG